MPSSAISSATSRMVEVPLPLSLMPGPATTESRWAPTTTTLSGSPVGESARMFVVRALRLIGEQRPVMSPLPENWKVAVS
jgi:hypothetical protein